jgi:hypothetical protein
MGQYKPMVKMMTTEPSVILKLKKGGKVAAKAGKDDGHKPMSGANPFAEAESGMAPKKPSMAERRRSMNPNQYAKGGKVAHKQMGGGMPMAMPGALAGAASPAPAPMRAMGRQALAGMPPAQRAKRAAMVQRAMAGMKDGGSAECKALEKELKHHESMPMGKAHVMKKASGGIIMSKSGKTKMVTATKGKTTGSTGEVKEGQPGGYKSGGGVKMGNAGGFAKGGKVPGLTDATVEGDACWENKPANSAKPGVKGTTTGEVRKGNAGGFMKGGSAKKAYATGGNVVDDGKAEKMPRHFVSRPVANSLQSGTFKKGGKVNKFSEGGSQDMSKGAYDRHYANEKKENEAMRESILGAPKRAYEAVKGMLSSPSKPPAGSITKTEKSVTVAPKKRGGMC